MKLLLSQAQGLNRYGASLIAALTSVNFHRLSQDKDKTQTPETSCGRVDPLRNFRDEYEELIKALGRFDSR